MPNTYSQIYIQVIFATKGRENKIRSEFREEIEKYITGIFTNKGQKIIAIYLNPDHIHIFFSYKNLMIGIPELMKVVKIESTNFINDKKMVQGRFSWQLGYGAFLYAKSQKDAVTKYILTQEEHHRKRGFREEYLELLNKFEVDFKEEYLFEFYDDL